MDRKLSELLENAKAAKAARYSNIEGMGAVAGKYAAFAGQLEAVICCIIIAHPELEEFILDTLEATTK